MVVLNDISGTRLQPAPSPSVGSPDQIAESLLDLARSLKAAALTPDGLRRNESVDAALAELATRARLLAEIDADRLVPTRSARHRAAAPAFWINIYNALVIHAALALGVHRRVTEVPSFFAKAAYRVAHHLFSLDDIEHGVLRANRNHPARPWPRFLPGDPRRPLVIFPIDRRIHFALNCGARSCPPIRHYTAAGIDQELELAARSFCSRGGVRIDDDTKKVVLSRLFLWYSRDFGIGKKRKARLAAGFLDDPERTRVIEAIENLGVCYGTYDWTIA